MSLEGCPKDSIEWSKNRNTLFILVFFPVWLLSNLALSAYQACIGLKVWLRMRVNEIISDTILVIVVIFFIIIVGVLLSHSEGFGLLLSCAALWLFYQLKPDHTDPIYETTRFIRFKSEFKWFYNEKIKINQEIVDLSRQLSKPHSFDEEYRLTHDLARAKWQRVKCEKNQDRVLSKGKQTQERLKLHENKNQWFIKQLILSSLSFLTGLAGILSVKFGLDMLCVDMLIGCLIWSGQFHFHPLEAFKRVSIKFKTKKTEFFSIFLKMNERV